MGKLFDLVIKTGSYTNNNGEEKGRYKNIGACMQGQDGGMFLLLDRTFNPAGAGEGEACLISMFEPKQREQQQQFSPQQPQQQAYAPQQPQYQGNPLPPDLGLDAIDPNDPRIPF